jgi:hypothetical protein
MGFPLQPGLMEDAYRGYDDSASQYQEILTLRLQANFVEQTVWNGAGLSNEGSGSRPAQ